jgi:hypothetical protein
MHVFLKKLYGGREGGAMVFNATFNNIKYNII